MVDDEYICAHALCLMLKCLDQEADTANNGRIAIQKVLDKYEDKSCDCNYRLIFMDCNMPVMNGYEACMKLKGYCKSGKIGDVYIVACSADTSKHNTQKCKEHLFDMILNKPVSK